MIARRVDDRRNRTAEPLAAAKLAIDFRLYCGTHYQLLLHWVDALPSRR